MSVLKYFNQSTQQWETLAKGEKGEPGTGNGDMVASIYDPANGQKQVAFQDTTYTKTEVDAQVANATPADATTTSKGVIKLAGELGGTADLPTVPGLAAKEPTIASGTTSQYYRGDKTWQALNKSAVGLSNVDNTSDANKPVSTATQTAIDAAVASAIAQSKQQSYPVGSLYFNADNATNPASLLGFGTWVAYAQGQVPVGKASSGTFSTAGTSLGAERETLALSHIPNVTGSITMHGSENATQIYNASGVFHSVYQSPRYGNLGTGISGAQSIGTLGFNLGGGGQSHNNIQPSIVVYIWKRTA